MAEFVLERKLRPTNVTLDLLRQLERVMLEDIKRHQAGDSSPAPAEFSISITDAFGTETIGTIGDFRPSLLPDSTNRIGLRYLARSSRERILVDISFGLLQNNCRLKIEVIAPSARETAVAIADSIQNILAPHHRLRDIAHPGSLISSSLAFGGVIGLMMLLLTWDSKTAPQWLPSVGLVLLVVGAAHINAGKLRPYSVFDSVASRRKNQIWNWFVWGVLSFVVFGSLLTAFRQKLFGF